MHGDPYQSVFGILDTLPLGTVTAIVYVVYVTSFICTTLDATSLCLASTTANALDKENNPGNKLRLFWCIMLTKGGDGLCLPKAKIKGHPFGCPFILVETTGLEPVTSCV